MTPSNEADEQEILAEIETALEEAKKTISSNDTAHILWLVRGLDLWHRSGGMVGHSLEECLHYVASSTIRQRRAYVNQTLDRAIGKAEAFTEWKNKSRMINIVTGFDVRATRVEVLQSLKKGN